MNTLLDLSELTYKLGQLFMAGIPGTQIDDTTEALIRDYNLGGFIFFSRNIQDPLQLAELCRSLQQKALKYHGTPLFLAVDQEGGRVARLKGPFTRFSGNEAIGKDPKPILKAKEFAKITAREMKMVGLNMNLAPVLDVQQGELEEHLAGRTFGKDPELVAELGKTVVRIMQSRGIMAVAKHFPGLGRADLDPHLQLPTIEFTQKELDEINLPPFKSAIETGVSAVMTSHAVYPLLDAQNPATVSKAILTRLLRQDLGFEGLVITDDLEMGAIAKHRGVADGAAGALCAGADILLICHHVKNLMDSFHLIRDQLLKGAIHFEMLIQASERIKKAKLRFLKPLPRISMAKINRYFKSSESISERGA